MNESKLSKKTDAKKVGADGLTKKERRALKVQTQNKQNALINQKDASDEINKQCKSNNALPEVKSDIICYNNKEDTTKLELKALRKAKFDLERATKLKQDIGKTEEEPKLSKAELRAARRQLQEKQREAKVLISEKQIKQSENIKEEKKAIQDSVAIPKKSLKKTETINKHQVQLFNHLYFKSQQTTDTETNFKYANVHPAFTRLGIQYLHKTILGSNARCLALLSALDLLVKDYEAPKNQEFCRSLESSLQNCVNYLQSCRPLAVSMTNALRHFKLNLTQVDTNLSDNQKKAILIDVIETYIQDEIKTASKAISLKVQDKITNGDVILTFGCSSLIKKILSDAHKAGKKFEVIVVDARPLLEGREMLRYLINLGMKCTYILINALSFIMNRATKIILGAHALLANGFVMSRTGTAQIALIAQAYNKPVLVCCETHKFCERVQTDSFVYNEIGDPDQLVFLSVTENSSLSNWKDGNNVTPLNLLYDVTPPDLVTAVVTELGFLPCTSVPVVLRIKPNELN